MTKTEFLPTTWYNIKQTSDESNEIYHLGELLVDPLPDSLN